MDLRPGTSLLQTFASRPRAVTGRTG